MSGQQIGTVIGGAIGAYFGGPAGAQLGMAIGGAIGGAVDPTHINGPKIGDGQQQTATDGAPIAWVQGTALIAGTLCQVSKRRQIRHKDDGKGGGTVAVTFTAVQDFAILVCESCELRDSTMGSVLMVLQDGKLVYDVRAGSTMLADSAKWKANVDFMFGAEDQLPHPTLEAITGVGNTPAYRGSLLAVFKNFDVSQAGDRIPSFQFVVSAAPTASQSSQSGSGGTVFPGVYSVPTGGYRGNVVFSFDMFNAPDKMQVFDGDTLVIDTGYRGAVSYQSALDSALASHGLPPETITPPGAGSATYLKATVSTSLTVKIWGPLSTGWQFTADFPGTGGVPQAVGLSDVCTRIIKRGGLLPTDVDVDALQDIIVEGYPIARQSNAADCLLPLLQAYFGYASEYDAKLRFSLYGSDAAVVVDRADLIEGNDSNNGAITSNLRNQSTEFPRRVVGSYMDSAQNYTVVNVPAERRAVDVVAIGDQAFQIPVVMTADDATKAVNKALKVAYATLEGTLEYAVPFAESSVYLTLAAGEPLQFRGKRYVLDEMMIGNGNLKLTTRYDRQGAYTSNVQAILGNAPTPPASPYSGPTTLIPMNLPSLRPQDTYGLYLAAASADGRPSWQGCTVQVSYDNQTSWQSALRIVEPSVFGALTVDEPVGGEPLTTQMNGDLESATDDQLAANENAFALLHSAGAEIGQFKTATETTTTEREYELTDVTRGGLGTTQSAGVVGDPLVMLDAVYFLPIDLSFKGKTIYFRAVGFGEIAEDADIASIIYTPDTTVIHDGGTVT